MPGLTAHFEERPTADEVRAALDRIAVSDAFRVCPQLVAFLRYVVEATLRGGQHRIKGYTIAVEALGRGDDFDPQDDPIVRVEAMRLRRALNRYYQNGGSDDPVRIELPLGSYVPLFRRGAIAGAGPKREAGPEQDSPGGQRLHDFLAFLAAYLANDITAAERQAARMSGDSLGLMARALVAAQRGETQVAREMLDRLAAPGVAQL
jgi:hypothetical protein